MQASEMVYRAAVEFIDAGHHRFTEVLNHCLADSPLEAVDAEAGFGVVDTLIDILEDSGEIWVDEDADLVRRVEEIPGGLVLTHRMTADELNRQLVAAVPDLVAMFLSRDPALEGGGFVGLRYDWGDGGDRYHPDGSLEGPPGWLERFSPGETVAFAHGRDGLRLDLVEASGDGSAEQHSLAEVFAEISADRSGVGFDATLIVDKTLMRDSHLFRAPVRPIGELLVDAGLELDGTWVGREGEEWEPLYVLATVDGAVRFAEERGLARCCVSGVETVVSYSMGRAEDPGDVNSALNHGAVADTFEDWWLERWGLEERRFADLLEPLLEAGGRNRAGARYLLALHHDARGEAVSAELQLEQAIAEDADYPSTLWMLAGYASDRGDPRRAVALWQRSGEDSGEGPIPFHQNLETRFEGVGRNEPCPCGSGRKFKHCHLGKPIVPDEKRVAWAFDKLLRFVGAHHRHDAVLALVVDALSEDVDELPSLLGAEFVHDIAVFEDGILEDFIAERADLLPDDEIHVFDSWAGQRLRCWEVAASNGVDTVTLLDTATGESVDVHDHNAAGDLHAGELILARVLPAFGAHWLSPGGFRVDLRWRDELLALLDDYPEPEVWVGWYDGLLAPPTLVTTDGEALVLSSAIVSPANDWGELERILDHIYERIDDGWWHEVHRTGAPPEDDVIRGTLRRDGEVLEIHTNSVERLDHIVNTLGEIVEVIERNEVPFDPTAVPPVVPIEPAADIELSPLDRAAIVERIEERWLGESVPALGGLTPRQAANDPTRRDDLIALLAAFERRSVPERVMTFDPASLRRKLGLHG
jgi:hypothetical protein